MDRLVERYLREHISELIDEELSNPDFFKAIRKGNHKRIDDDIKEAAERAREILMEKELRKIFPPLEEDILFGADLDPEDPEPEPVFDYSDLVTKALEEDVAIDPQDRFKSTRGRKSRRSFMRTKPHRPSLPGQLERMREMERDRRREEERRINRLFSRRARTPGRANEWNQLGERRRNLD